MTQPTIDFHSIREHHGDKRTGFEELVVQLVPWIDDVDGHEVVRHGSPDGGVEAVVEFEDGRVWGWQAKYFFTIGDSQLKQMKRSFEQALETQPTLSRYTFVLPFNPPAGKPKHGKSALAKLEAAFTRWRSMAIALGREVDLSFVGESRLTNILTAEEHAALVLYWFDQRLLFSDAWLKQQLGRAINAAGTRYTPELNVELPVGFIFEGLGRTAMFDKRLASTVASVDSATRDLRPPESGSALADAVRSRIEGAAREIDALVSELADVPVAGTDPINWEPELARISELRGTVEALAREVSQRAEHTDRAQAGFEPSARSDAVDEFHYAALRVEHALDGLEDFLRAAAATLAAKPLLFLSGVAGSGKTHLLCDVARRRIEEGLPTVLVLGQQLQQGSPRRTLPLHLDLPDLTMDQFLKALDVAGERSGARALLFIDGINEQAGLEAWPTHLRALAAEVSGYPHVGLVVSCRSSYVEAILSDEPEGSKPEDLGFVELEHQGFASQELKAATKFFEYWELMPPDFPLLVPEYSNPLFLKLFCQSLHQTGEATLPRGATGITALFARFLQGANHQLSHARRCNYRKESDLVAKAVQALAERMLDRSVDSVPFSEFHEICEAILPGRTWDKSLQRGLIDEGVVARDRSGDNEAVWLSYQRLSDHLQAARLLEGNDGESLREFLASLASDRGSFYRRTGLLEAVAIQLPEKRGQELHELVPEPQHHLIVRAFLESIVWRDPRSFPSDLALDYVNSAVRTSRWHADKFLNTILQVACVPNHPFNARLLHSSLTALHLPDRDAWWTTYVNQASKEEPGAYRIIEWAGSAQQQMVDDDLADLAGTTLTWMLAASNRGLRDCATKALIVLMWKRIPLLIELLNRFDAVDDPYVEERLYAVAYGCATATSDTDALEMLAGAVFDKVFAGGRPPVHVMLRDYARGVVEVAAERGALPARAELSLVRPPYSSPWPVRAPSLEQIERRAPWETHSTLHFSLTGALGDFTNYSVNYAVQRFEAPNQRQRRRQRASQRRDAANDAARKIMVSLGAAETALPPSPGEESDSVDAFLASLNAKQLARRARRQRHERPPEPPVMWEADEAARWIFRRVLELGWTPERFGDYDRIVRSPDRLVEDGRTERIGKKYQWIAFHELLARISDHCRYRPWPTADPEPYAGPWQLGCRDIDPTITFQPIRPPFDHSPVTWWQPLDVKLGRFIDADARAQWAVNDSDIPTPDDLKQLLKLNRDDGSAWLTLEGHYAWREDQPEYLQSSGQDAALVWLQVRSYVIPRRSFSEFKRWAGRQDWFGRWMPEGVQLSQVYWGEWPWHPSASEYSSAELTTNSGRYQQGEAPADVLPTCADYRWEEDASMPGGAAAFLPARWLMERLDLRSRPGSFKLQDADRRVVSLDPAGQQLGPSALLIREGSLRQLLDDANASIIWTVLGEKAISGQRRPFPEVSDLRGVGALESGGSEIEVTRRTRSEFGERGEHGS